MKWVTEILHSRVLQRSGERERQKEMLKQERDLNRGQGENCHRRSERGKRRTQKKKENQKSDSCRFIRKFYPAAN